MMIQDISVLISAETTPLFPGDPRIRIHSVASMAKGDALDLSMLAMGSHTATHIDAPSHFVKGGASVDAIPLEACFGLAQVREIDSAVTIGRRELEAAGIPVGTTRLLLKTRNSRLWRTLSFDEEFVALAPEGADWLLERGVRLVGIDYLSIEAYGAGASGFPVHKALLQAGVVILEGVDLSDVAPGAYTLACFPLKLSGCDGAPVRAVLMDAPPVAA
jgi:arylformamidase